MLLPHSRLLDVPVMSLQTGAELARTSRPIIDPRNLKIIAFELDGEHLDETPSLIRIEDIREASTLGFIVDSSDEFIGVDDVIKIKQVYMYDFRLLDLPVIDTHHHKLGTVCGFTYEPKGYVIQQLNVKRPFLLSLADAEKLIHRSQIISIKDDAIIVNSADQPKSVALPVGQKYQNPFRQPNTQPDAVQSSNR